MWQMASARGRALRWASGSGAGLCRKRAAAAWGMVLVVIGVCGMGGCRAREEFVVQNGASFPVDVAARVAASPLIGKGPAPPPSREFTVIPLAEVGRRLEKGALTRTERVSAVITPAAGADGGRAAEGWEVTLPAPGPYRLLIVEDESGRVLFERLDRADRPMPDERLSVQPAGGRAYPFPY